ncbi:MAG: serine hydrolase [Anaerolineae bacterium]|nr:serine hydrolase [Anaerolineae bacterium]
MARMHLLCALLLMMILPSLAPTQPTQADDPGLNQRRFEVTVRRALQNQEISGAVFLLLAGDEIVYHGAIGRAANGEPLDPDAAFTLGGLGEGLASLMLYTQVERGRLLPDTPFQNLDPSLRLADPAAVQFINAQRLMNHSAGLGYDPTLPSARPLEAPSFAEVAPYPPPNRRFSYCNRCTGLLIDLIETLGGASYPQLLEEKLFYPLFMDSTQVTEAGEVHTTPQEFARVLSLHLQRGRWRGVQVITPESTRALHASRIETQRGRLEWRGYGWFVYPNLLPGRLEITENRVIVGRDLGRHQVQAVLIPHYGQGILMIAAHPSAEHRLDAVMNVALQNFVGWQFPPSDPTDPLNWLTGIYRAEDGTDITLRLNAAGSGLEVEYLGSVAPAQFVEPRALVFPYQDTWVRVFYPGSGTPGQIIRSIEGETELFFRRG